MLREADDATLAEAAAALRAIEATAAASGTAGTPPAVVTAESPSALAGPLTAAATATDPSTNTTAAAAAAAIYTAAATSRRQYFITLYSGSAIKVRRSDTSMHADDIDLSAATLPPWRKLSMHLSCITLPALPPATGGSSQGISHA